MQVQIPQAFPLQELDLLLEALSPNEPSYARRHEISGFIERVLRQGGKIGEGCRLFGSGSFTSRTYLPASDIDLVLITGRDDEDDSSIDINSGLSSSNEMKHIMSVFEALCTEVSLRDSGNSVLSSVQNPMTIRNVEFINARTKLCHCLVNNVGIDVTINSTGALTTVLFIEECDRCFGKNHLFKKSLMLIKAWALNESPSYVGQSLLGSKTGMLSSYALCVLVLCLFNQYPNLCHPLAVLLAFFQTYAEVDWGNVVVTIHGIMRVTPTLRASGNLQIPVSLSHPLAPFLQNFSSTVDSLRETTSSGGKSKSSSTRWFSLRSCNIQDPVDASNNLGYSVSRLNLELLTTAFKAGRDYFEHMLRGHYANMGAQGSLPDYIQRVNEEANSAMMQQHQKPVLRDMPFVRRVFPSSYREYILSVGTRGDLLDHPMQTWKNGKEIAPPPGAPEASFLERLHASALVRGINECQQQQSRDLLCGDLKDMRNALGVAFLREAKNVPSLMLKEETLPTGVVATGSANEGAETNIDTPFAIQTPSRTTQSVLPSVETTEKESESPSLSLPSLHHSNSPIDSNGELYDDVSDCRADSPSHASASGSIGSGASSPPPSPTSAQELSPSLLHHSHEHEEPRMDAAPEWSVEPELHVPAAAGSGSGGGNKRAKKKKKKGSSSSLPMAGEPASIGSDTASSQLHASIVDVDASDLRGPPSLRDSTTRLRDFKKYWSGIALLFASLVAVALVAVAVSLVLQRATPEFSTMPVETVREQTILAPSLSGAEALSSLDVSLSAVTLDDGTSDTTTLSRFHGAATAEEGGNVVLSPSTIWATKGQVLSLGTSSAQCPLIGLGAVLKQAVADGGLAEVVKVDDDAPCPIVIPPPRFEWRLNGRPIDDRDGLTVAATAITSPFYTIYGASADTQGEYTCVIKLSGASAAKSALALGDDLNNIAVSGRRGMLDEALSEDEKLVEIVFSRVMVHLSTPPEITKSRSAFFDLAEGQPLYLDVNAEASPPPSFQWFLNGVALPGERRKTLNIGNIKKEHAGAYTCEVTNVAGSVTFMDITVSVKSSPISEPRAKPDSTSSGSSSSSRSIGGQPIQQKSVKPPTRKRSARKAKS